jgi:hypothetical protein
MWVILFLVIPTLLFGQDRERWDVKTLTDTGCHCIDTNITIRKQLSSLSRIKLTKVGDQHPRMAFECNVIEVTGIIKRIRKEPDGDRHFEIGSPQSKSGFLVCEVKDPNDPTARRSKYLPILRTAHNAASVLKKGDRVTVRGVMFQDQKHGRLGKRMANYLEIHPVLFISKQ